MYKPSRLCKGLALAFGGLSILSAPALAQSDASQATLQRVEVTGSNIRRAESETASAVQVVSREEIDRSGKTSVAQLLQTLSVDNQGSVPTTFGAGFASGASGISLRGLGSASTLVLINGRRVAPYGLADDGQKVFADLNVIPLEAVERVEILKDGASSIYGSDAIAGVVNIILRKDYQGGAVKLSAGRSGYGDGADNRAAISAGWGDLAKDRYNMFFNLELGKKDAIFNSQRAGRDQIGRSDLRDMGLDANQAFGGSGAILQGGAASATTSINGNVRNPTTLLYYNRGNTDKAQTGFTRNFDGAACGNFTTHAQGDPGGGCLVDAPQLYQQIQPSEDTKNFFGRGTFQFSPSMTGFVELNLYKNDSRAQTFPTTVSASNGYPGGPVANTAISLGANHPDNPYFGTAARLRYMTADIGPRVSNVSSNFTRFLTGLQGNISDWDYDTGLLYSESKVSNRRTGYVARDAAFALLNPTGNNLSPTMTNAAYAAANNPAYAALPAGSYYRIAENANLNSAALYAALSPTIANDAVSKSTQIDFKASRELAQLGGGALGLAVGAEVRRESVRLDPTSGTERGNIIGLGYSAYDGARTVSAVYAEILAPVTKQLELSGALRADHYSDVGNSYTPKVGFKWTPSKDFALRGTFAEGFRAPSAAENGRGGLAAFSTAADPVRCALGITAACSAANVAVITSPNPGLVPEKSKTTNLGAVWDLVPGSSMSLDLWQIKRSNEINQEETTAAIAAGHVARDPSSALAGFPGDPGPITAVLANYVNSAQTTVRGLDFDFNQKFNLGEAGKLSFDAKWTHLFTFRRTEKDGSSKDYAGTHGNCDATNCMGTPADRMNIGATWEKGNLKLSTVVTYRGSIEDKNFKNDPAGCAVTTTAGFPVPANCRIDSFTTVDVSFRWKAAKGLEVYGSIQNLFDAVAPFDPLTYGAVAYNPLDYSGAVGRYFSLGMRYKF